jgi:hypothetical protein
MREWQNRGKVDKHPTLSIVPPRGFEVRFGRLQPTVLVCLRAFDGSDELTGLVVVSGAAVENKVGQKQQVDFANTKVLVSAHSIRTKRCCLSAHRKSRSYMQHRPTFG